MGKLHTLRREIKRNPEKWISKYSNNALGARFDKKESKWVPLSFWTFYNRGSYRSFVKSVLLEVYNASRGS